MKGRNPKSEGRNKAEIRNPKVRNLLCLIIPVPIAWVFLTACGRDNRDAESVTFLPVAQVSKPAGHWLATGAADLEIGDTADLEVCATYSCPC